MSVDREEAVLQLANVVLVANQKIYAFLIREEARKDTNV